MQRIPAGAVKLNKAATRVENTATGVKVSCKGRSYTTNVAVSLFSEIPKGGC